MEVTKEVRTMTTKEEVRTEQGLTPAVPETLTQEHHDAIKASWELPAYQRESRQGPAPRSRKPLLVGIVTGAVCLAVGFGAGYWTHSQMVEPVAPIVISRVAGPVDANGMTLGRRVAPFDTMTPTELPVRAATDANGMTLGRRVAPIDTMTPTELPVQAATDANGMTLGRRVAPID
jgi:hypothetical protein